MQISYLGQVKTPREKLSWLQRLVRVFVSRTTFERMRAESQAWKLTCPACGYQTDYWAQGGIRYRASSWKKVIPGRCPSCGKWVAFEVTYLPDKPTRQQT